MTENESGNENANLSARLAAIEDRDAIADLVYRYAEAIRNGRPKECLDLMAADAVVEVHHADPDEPGQTDIQRRYTGIGEIEASFEDSAGSSARVWPMIHNLRIQLDGRQARANCVMMSAIWPHGKEYVGEYHDTFRKEGDGWKFTSRKFAVFGDTTGRYSRDAHVDYLTAKTGIGD